MAWNVRLTLTDASNGSPQPGVPVTGSPQGTLLGTTDASGSATVALNVDTSGKDLGIRSTSPPPGGPVRPPGGTQTWILALVITDPSGSGCPGVTVRYLSLAERVKTGSGGAATLRLTVNPSLPSGLQLSVEAPESGRGLSGSVTVSETLESTVLGVVGVRSGTTLATFD